MSSQHRLQVILNHLQTPVVRSTSAQCYNYTLDNKRLSNSQRSFYEENGFVLIPNLINYDLLDDCRQRFIELCNGIVSKGNMTLMKDISLSVTSAKGERLYNKVQDIVWDDVFSKYIVHPDILEYVECFTGPNVSAVHSMLINKPPDSGKMTSQHPLHQDLHYFPFRPAEKIVASWTAMERVTVDNGCLFVIPGTHKGSLLPHDYPENEVNKAYHGVKGFDKVARVNLEMEKGDTVFFHPLLLHGSGPNITKGFRKAISCHYASNDCYYIDVTGTSQENIAVEVKAIAKKRGLEMSYEDIWRYRKRWIKGSTETL